MLIFILTVFLSSFLLFAVQPLIAKFLLPSFGGAAGVWATCLVFFQVLLLGGYAYAHWLCGRLSRKAQRWTHLCLLAIAVLFVPPIPVISGTVNSAASPVWQLLWALASSIGVPFFALSATAPLLMEWFRQARPESTPDRLYAFSNAGSLLALLAYPVLVEPLFARSTQARLWALGMGLFLLACAATAWRSWRVYSRLGTGIGNGSRVAPGAPASLPAPSGPPAPAGRVAGSPGGPWLWVALPACGSGLLLALTNQISQDVAPTPLLWVAPLAVYLVTFILCFESPRWYNRALFIPAGLGSFFLLAWLLDQGYLQGFWVQVGGYLGVLFLGCMMCHGELYRLRPPPERLTAYYLAISVGGALGGIFVALVAPAVFRTLLETPIIAVTTAALVTVILWKPAGFQTDTPAGSVGRGNQRNPNASKKAAGRDAGAPRSRPFPISAPIGSLLATLAIGMSLGYVVLDLRKESIYFSRSFYGAYRVKEGPTLLLNGVDYPLAPGPARVLLSGQIYHGLQFTSGEAARMPTSYFSDEGGLGLAFRELPADTNRSIGVIGLGAGTVAAYGRPGDRFRFYELNPDVLRIAQSEFSFLKDCAGKVQVVLGDGRLSLEREPSQQFDLLILDAFSGDSIPLHLLTDEAMQIYKRHVKAEGVMAFHISNSHLDLEPVVRALAAQSGVMAVIVPPKLTDVRAGKLPSVWMLLSANPEFFQRPGIANLTSIQLSERKPLLWTDDYSSILPILH